MKTKRFTSILLALLLVMNLCIPAFAAETPALELSVDKTEATVGDTITVTISCDTEITGIQGWGMDLYLDNAAYKLVDSAIYGGYNEMFGEVTDNIEKHSSVNISAFTLNSKYLLTIPNGTLATLTFEVIGASDKTFQLKDVGANYPDDMTPLLAETSNAVQVTAKEEERPEAQGYPIPITTTHLNGYIANIMVNGVTIVDGPETSLGYGHLEQTSTVYVSKENKNDTATLSYDIVKTTGLTGSVEDFTVALENGYGTVTKSFSTAEGKNINVTIKFEPSPCAEHNWQDATCTSPKICSECGKTEGSALGHNFVNGVCSDCGEEINLPFSFSAGTISTNGTEWCEMMYATVTNMILTVPAGTESVTITPTDDSIEYWYGMDHEDDLVEDIKPVVLDLTKIDLLCLNVEYSAGDKYYHITIEVEEAAECSHSYVCGVCILCDAVGEGDPGHDYVNGKCSMCQKLKAIPFTATANGATVEFTRNDTETCPYYKNANVLKATVPYGTDSVTIALHDSSITYWDAYADEDDLLTEKLGTPIVVDLSKNYNYVCINTINQVNGKGVNTYYHVYIEVEESAHEHSYEAVVTKPDCTEGGYTTYTCSCGDYYVADEVPATGHSYVCGVCTICDAEGEGDPGHDYVNGKCSKCQKLKAIPFTATANGATVEFTRNDTETCPYYKNANVLKATVPYGTDSVTIALHDSSITYWDAYADEDDLLTEKLGTPIVVDLSKNYNYVCINTINQVNGKGVNTYYHVYIEIEESEEPELPVVDGYTVTMPADTTAVAGEIVSIPVVIDNKDGSAYNAFDISFTYDENILKLTSTEIEGMTVEAKNGTVRVLRYGEDLNVGSAAFTLTFKAIGTGETAVTATSAKVGVAATATELDAADATILDADTVITIGGYSVTLPDDFTSDRVVAPGADYTFTAMDKNYNYTVSATMGGQDVDVNDNGDGTFTIENVTGNLVITSSKEGKTFGVTLGDDMTGNTTAQYMTAYTATLTKVDGYTYDLKVTIGGNDYTGFSYDETTGVVTVPGADITGAIAFNSNKTKVQASEYTVTFEGNGAGDAVGENKVAAGADYSFTLNKAEGCTYTVSYKMGNSTESTPLTEADGKFTIAKVSGNLVITVEKESDLAVEVGAYVELDGKTVFLVRATGTLADGKAYAYNGDTMYYSNVYKAWSWLVIVEEGNTFTADDAKTMITAVEAEYTTLDQTFDVNMTDKVDVNDAQLVYNFYNCEYNDFSVAPMLKFLNADVNGDKVVDTLDAAAVVNAVINGNN